MGTQRILTGRAVTPAIAIGPAVVCRLHRRVPHSRQPASAYEPLSARAATREIERLKAAITAADAALVTAEAQLKAEGQLQAAQAFYSQRMLLTDPALLDRAIALIVENDWLADEAIVQVGSEQTARLDAADDAEIRAHAADISALVAQVWRILVSDTQLAERLQQPAILVADDIGPSELMSLPRDKLLGLVLSHGGLTAHAAILVRAWSVPALIDLGENLFEHVQDGMTLALDGTRGELVINPDSETIAHLQTAAEVLLQHQRELRSQRDQVSITRDGQHVPLLANVSSMIGAQAAREWGAAGIGSLRTELLFLGRSARLPSEDEQVEIYLEVAAELPGLPIVARTLDIGGDKQLPIFPLPREDNPFLGWRGIRIGLSHPQEMLLPQLRAMLRAGAAAEIRIVPPMVATLHEWRQLRLLFDQARAELKADRIPHAEHAQLGILIEVPAAALIIDQLAREADFISIGSNDLIQYTLACDRTNPRVAHLYQPLEPAILHLIATISEAGHRYGRKVSLCGEMASDPQLTALLIGLGIDELSCTPPALPDVRAAVRATSKEAAQQLARAALQASTPDDVRALLTNLPDQDSSTACITG